MDYLEEKMKELRPIDYHREKKSITALFEGDKILIINMLELNKVIYSFFINRQLIGSGVDKPNKFFKSFKKYLSL